jgi:preprotein translocase subunit YajC
VQRKPRDTQQSDAGAMQQYTTLIFIALLAVAFYFLILRPQRRRQAAIQQTMNSISPGDRVMLASGLFGTVISVGTRQIVLEISPGAELTVLKQAISRIVTDEDEDSVDEHDELDDHVESDEPGELQEQYPALRETAAPEEPLPLQTERPIDEPTTATTPEPVVEPKTSPARDGKPSTAE